MRRGRPAWMAALAVAALATIIGLWLVTRAVRKLEAQQAQSQSEFERAEVVRLALWRMDGWMTPRLAREAARPVHEYAAFFSPLDPVNKLLQSVPKGEVLSPSPLLLESPDWIPLHFEWKSDGTLTSPQVPQGNLLDLAEGQYFQQGVPADRSESLKRLAVMLAQSKQPLDACVAQAELSNSIDSNAKQFDKQFEEQLDAQRSAASDGKTEAWNAAQSKRALDDYTTRAKASNDAQQQQVSKSSGRMRQQVQYEEVPKKEDSVQKDEIATIEDSVGPLVATWISTDPPELAFVRRVQERGETRVQGFLVDWPRLSATLLAQVTDLVTAARLAPVLVGIESFAPARLASIPAELQGEMLLGSAPIAESTSTPALLFAWGAALLALAAAAIAAWMSMSFGDRQARFASSVTHELRTPLTTFQLYAEMLRDGMVTDEARRKECLDTLCHESVRLSHLVENVLSLSRLERGTKPNHRKSSCDASEVSRIIEAIAHERANGSSCVITNDLASSPAPATVNIDREALAQILANLIENAAKYGRSDDEPAAIQVEVGAREHTLVITVRDSGPGISARAAASIWRPFDRAGREGGTQFGLGLGLPVSRALAEGMGGTLNLLKAANGAGDGSGACFELRVPAAIERS